MSAKRGCFLSLIFMSVVKQIQLKANVFYIINFHARTNINPKENKPNTHAILFVSLFSFFFEPIIASIIAIKLRRIK